MIIYRPHRGSLTDSLSKAQEFSTWQELKEHVAADWNSMGCGQAKSSDVTIKTDMILDKRIGWNDTRMVLCKGYPVGFCSTQYKSIEDF